jgi:hypothetical protein
MRRVLFVALPMFAMLFSGAIAQEAKKQDAKKDTPTAGTPVDIHFLNGSTVRLQILSEKLDVETPYGKLAVPIKDILAIEFGTHLPDGHSAKIETAIKKLGSGDFREREKAAAALVDLGPYSYGAVVAATNSSEAETANRAKTIVQKLQAKFPSKDLKINADDRVTTPTFPIVGRILTPSVKAKADYFGAVELSLADMRTMRLMGNVSGDLDVKVAADKYSIRGQWLPTNFQVDGRSRISITAKGTVDLMPDDPGQMMVGPGGYRVTVANPGGFGGGGGFGKKASAKSNGGLLVGKIGESGETFVIGERYEGTPAQQGRLYLQIYPSPYSTAASGFYEVKASAK